MAAPAALRAALLLAALAAAVPAAGQGFPAVRPGQTVSGRLTADDPAFVGGHRFRVFRLDAVQGRTYFVGLGSRDFDAYLGLARAVGGLTETLAGDDDGGTGTDARLRFTAPATGSYLLVVQALAENGLGDFSLKVEQAPEPAPGPPRALHAGAVVGGTLSDTDVPDEEDGAYHDRYLLQARRGQRFAVEMRSDSLDAYLRVGRAGGGGGGGAWTEIASDDDGAGRGTDARLRFTAPADGTYEVRASALGSWATGPYTLAVQERPAAPEARALPLPPSGTVAGTLSDTDAEREDGAFLDVYAFAGRAGEPVTLALESDDFDTFLVVGRRVDGAFQEVASMDDGGEGTHALLPLTLAADGEYLVHVTSLLPGATGAYRLRLQRGR